MAEKEVIETSEAEIAVHWGEEEYYHPSKARNLLPRPT
jgi:acetyl-CoA synthetase